MMAEGSSLWSTSTSTSTSTTQTASTASSSSTSKSTTTTTTTTSTGSGGITVQSVDQNNSPIYGYYTLLCTQGTSQYQNGSNSCETGVSRLSSGYTTVTFTNGLMTGQSYGVEAYDGSCTFSYWTSPSYPGFTSPNRFMLVDATNPPSVFTAVYNCSIVTSTTSSSSGSSSFTSTTTSIASTSSSMVSTTSTSTTNNAPEFPTQSPAAILLAVILIVAVASRKASSGLHVP